MVKNDPLIQGVLINKIKSTLPANISLADELADLLEISSDSAYRRIRGETAFTIHEIATICEHFKFSFDSLMPLQQGLVNFNYNEVNTYSDYFRYLTEIRDELARFIRIPERHITYAAVDVPVFHYFAFPEYLHFKMFYWLRSVANDPEYSGKKYAVSDINQELTDICRELADLYAAIDSTEIWSESILSSVLKQVMYYWQTGVFASREDALHLVDSVKKTIQKVQRDSEMNMKLRSNGLTHDLTPNFQLFSSDIEIGNNFILVSLGQMKILYMSFHTFNKMFTTNQPFNTLTEKWMSNLIRQANLISGVGEKQRFRFFQTLYNQLDDLTHTIQ